MRGFVDYVRFVLTFMFLWGAYWIAPPPLKLMIKRWVETEDLLRSVNAFGSPEPQEIKRPPRSAC
jgi:hypothetical protein